MKGESSEKRNFTSRVRRNPFMRESVLKYQKYKCWFCNEEIYNKEQMVLHHLTYDWCCYTTETVKLHSPSVKRPSRVSKVPDCELCFKENKDRFCSCKDKLVAVHEGCHFLIHKDEIFKKRGLDK